jgi:hypothetical protein
MKYIIRIIAVVLIQPVVFFSSLHNIVTVNYRLIRYGFEIAVYKEGEQGLIRELIDTLKTNKS